MTGDGRFRPIAKSERAAKPRMTRIDPKETFDAGASCVCIWITNRSLVNRNEIGRRPISKNAYRSPALNSEIRDSKSRSNCDLRRRQKSIPIPVTPHHPEPRGDALGPPYLRCSASNGQSSTKNSVRALWPHRGQTGLRPRALAW